MMVGVVEKCETHEDVGEDRGSEGDKNECGRFYKHDLEVGTDTIRSVGVTLSKERTDPGQKPSRLLGVCARISALYIYGRGTGTVAVCVVSRSSWYGVNSAQHGRIKNIFFN